MPVCRAPLGLVLVSLDPSAAIEGLQFVHERGSKVSPIALRARLLELSPDLGTTFLLLEKVFTH